MDKLYPPDGPDSPEQAFASLAQRRGPNWVYASSALTINGKIKADHHPYGGAGDWRWYNLMRDQADFVIIGGETMRVSGPKDSSRYQHGPDRPPGRIVIISNSGELPLTAPLFTRPGPVTIYTGSDREFITDNDQLQVRRGSWTAAEILADLGPGRKMIDGGGYIYSLFAPYVDDWLLTTVPTLSSADQPEFWINQEELSLTCRWLWSEDDRLFARYQAKR